MYLRNLNLTISSISRNKTDVSALEVLEARINYEKLENGANSERVASYGITCAASHGDTINIAIPATCKRHYEILQERLQNGGSTFVTFDDLRIKAFAFVNKYGKLIAGVNGSAVNMAFTDEN